MAINTYDVGDLVKVSVLFTDVNDEPADPATVSLAFSDPSGNSLTYDYGSDPEVVKNSTGSYYVELSIDEAGDWFYRWYSTGAGQGSEQSQFAVKPNSA
jgi:hypothetical protein